MHLRTLAVIFFMLIFSCKAKESTNEGLQNDLKSAMQSYLYSSINNDSTNVKYRVQEVTYFEDTSKYICEFKVNMKAKLFDTTGTMKADISKDFKKVQRYY